MKAGQTPAPSANVSAAAAETQHEQNSWDAGAYAAHGRFVADLATEAVQLLAPRQGEHILDVGCGDGALTATLQELGATVLGIDRSPEMAQAAGRRGIRVLVEDIAHLSAAAEEQLRGRFDAVFSNAALHWISLPQQPGALRAIYASLRPGGRFVVEMGGQGNIAAIRAALQATFAPFAIDCEAAAASFYPSPPQYAELLRTSGFEVRQMQLVPRPTALPESGMAGWLTTFRNGVLNRLAPEQRPKVIAEVVELLRPILCDSEGNWTADYVRLRFYAVRPGGDPE